MNCRQCGLDHSKLGVKLTGVELVRTADKERHMLHKVAGGAWSFDAALIAAHPEVERITVLDRNSQEKWHTDRQTFNARGFDLTLGGKPQRALALKHWNMPAAVSNAEKSPVREIVTQQGLFDGRMGGMRTEFEKAKAPRPRAPQPQRRRWF